MTELQESLHRIRELERSLRMSQVRERLLADSMDRPVLLVGMGAETGQIVVLQANERAAEQLSMDRPQLMGMPLSELVAGDGSRLEDLLHGKEGAGSLIMPRIVLRSGKESGSNWEVISVHGDGEERTILLCPVESGSCESLSERREHSQSVLFDILSHSRTYHSMGAFFESIHRLMRRELRAENLYVALVDKGTDSLVFTYSVDKTITSCPTVDNISSPDCKRLSVLPLRQNRTVQLVRKELLDLCDKGELHIHGTVPNVWLGIPLRINGETIGVLVVQDYDTHQVYDEDEQMLLNVCADQISLALERKRNEQALQDSEKRFRLLYVDAPIAYQSLDDHGNFLEVNKAFCRMLGYVPSEILGRNFSDLLHPDWRKHFQENFPRFKAMGEVMGVEFQMRHKDGSYILVSFNGRIGRNQDGSFRQTYCVFRDITQERVTQDALEQSERRFRTLLEDMEMVAVQGYDEHRQVIYWNRASEQLYGFSREEALGRKLEDLIIPAPMRDDVVALVDNWVAKGEAIPAGELELRHKDGSPVPVYSSHVMQETISGAKEMYCIDIDLSDIKKAHKALLKAKEAAEAASVSKSLFLANMSHELRTPLSGISSMHHLLRSSPLENEQQEYVETAIQSAQRLTNLLGDILDLSRVEAGMMTMIATPFDLRETLSTAEQLFLPSCRNKGVELSVHVAEDVPPCLVGDQARLLQVLNNLVGNAVKFTERGSISISVSRLLSGKHADHSLLICVEDTGIGIDETQLDVLFEPFTQADEGYTRRYQGAGLGLSIVKKLVGLMHGNLAVDSEPGHGTTFYLSLSFGAADAIPDSACPLLQDGLPRLDLKVLIAEDDRVNQLGLKHLLELQGCRVAVVENGRQALDELRAQPFDCVFMDIQMPVMNGLDATLAIRDGQAGEERKHVPIIALTAYAMDEERQSFLDAGMDHYLSKPVSPEDLHRVLASIAN